MKITVNKKSWHYRWANFIDSKFDKRGFEPKSVCAYFWGFIGLNFMVFAIGTIVSVAIWLATAPIWGYIINTHVSPMHYKMTEISTGMGYVDIGLFAIVVGIFLISKAKGGIIAGYLYALKNKMCPMIEYTEKK